MKALTIRQPWAQLVAVGAKQIETRSWKTSYRGRIAIHAGANQHNVGIDFWDRNGHAKAIHSALVEGGYVPSPGFPPFGPPKDDDLRPVPLGAIVATANLVDVVPMVHVDEPWCGAEPYDADPGVCVVYRDEAVWHKVGDTVADMHDQYPFGEWLSGRFAWLLDDIKPTTERCPWCLDGALDVDGWCPVCDDTGTCDPIPAKGRQGLWRWAL